MERLAALLKTMDLEFFAKGKHKINPEQLFSLDNAVFLDVRSTEEVESVAFPLVRQATSLHIPTNEIPDRLCEIPRDKPIGIFCSAGTRASIVYAYLKSNGIEDVKIIVGGYDALFSCLKPGHVLQAYK